MVSSIPRIIEEVPVQEKMKAIVNVIDADATRDIDIITSHIAHAVNKGLTLQQIEFVLRDRKCFSHLIARKPKSNTPYLIEMYNGTKKTYYLWLSTMDRKIAMKEVLEESSSYVENYEKLNDTGFQIMDVKISK